MRKFIIAFISFCIVATSLQGAAIQSIESNNLDWQNDTLTNVPSEHAVTIDSIPKKRPGLVQRIFNYFDQSNDDKPDKKFDITFLGGPSYSASTSLQIAVIAAGLYRTQLNAETRQSNVSVFAQGSITGFYRVGIFGEHYAPNNRWRINYNGNFAHFPLKFWGLDFYEQQNSDNESDYTELQSEFFVEWQWRFGKYIYLGPSVNLNYGKATKAQRPELWNEESKEMLNYGMGLILSLDTRDFPTNASRGVQLTIRQRFFPRFIGNKNAFSETEFTFNWYKQWWKSGVIAFQLHGWSTYGNTPWTMLPTLDESDGIRGYYEGRYRAKQEADVVVEVRQHVWRRNGIVVWGGVGTVFDNFNQINSNRLLPSYGIGYRWEFKKKVNIRIDLGFGRNSRAFALGINETF